MVYFLAKTLISALLIAAISELARRLPLAAALLASLPLVSILSFIWIYVESGDTARISAMSMDIFWLVLVSLPFFLLLPWLLAQHWRFPYALLASAGAIGMFYCAGMWALRWWKGA